FMPQDLDDFEKLEQYAEEHPSMISTASYVDQIVFNDHLLHKEQNAKKSSATDEHYQLTKRNNLFNPQNDYMENENEDNELTNRIRQRKIKPFKNKIETIPIDRDSDDDDIENENDDWECAAVIPINENRLNQQQPSLNDDYNSDSGIGSLQSNLNKKKQISTHSTNFDDESSWLDRELKSKSSVNDNSNTAVSQLMMKTFPGLRQQQQQQQVFS
ncbi:unnamed protein product, partial [Didymodactylos carnosus]